MRLVLALVLAACGAEPPPQKSARSLPPIRSGEFVRTRGTDFVLGDQAVRFVGVNAALIHGEETRDAAPRLLRELARTRVQLARLWALGETSASESWQRHVAFRLGPGDWVDESFTHLDQVLDEAEAAQIRVVVVLANRWADRGGLPQYARWAGIEPRYRNLLPAELAATLRNETARELYLAHLRRIVGRTPPGGTPYRDRPTIAAWELINELSASTCAVQEALLPWVRDMAGEVRALDPNHLIAAGHIGYNSEQSLEFWTAVHQLDDVAYADTHGYPQNLLDVVEPAHFRDWLDHRTASAHAIGKPLLVGEVGIPRNDPAFSSRRAWLGSFLEAAQDNGTGGVLFWMARPWPQWDDPHGIWAWGPHEEESRPLRELLFGASKRWAQEAETSAPVASFPLGVDRIRPFVNGEWTEGVLEADPWAVTEGCVREGRGWLLYALPWQSGLQEIDLGLEGSDGTIAVSLNGQMVGALRDGAYEAADVQLPGGEVAWLRLVAQDAGGATSLARFTRQLPGTARLTIRAPAPRPGSSTTPSRELETP